MAIKNVFLRPVTEYKRDIDLVRDYTHIAGYYLHMHTREDLDACKQFVTQAISSGGSLPLTDRRVECFIRNEYGDRERTMTTVLGYIGDAVKAQQIIAPNWTRYAPHHEIQSLQAKEIIEKKKDRGVAKKKMQAARDKGDDDGYAYWNGVQTQKKRAANAHSGSCNTTSTPLYLKVHHSTLTSTCRITASTGNTSNERMISGARLYFTPDVAINDISTIAAYTDYSVLGNLINKYKLICPTAEQCWEIYRPSCRRYWHDTTADQNIIALLEAMTPLERAAAIYTGDLHSLVMLNQEFGRAFIGQLIRKVHGQCDDPIKFLRSLPDDYMIFAHNICAEELKGYGLSLIHI